MDHEVGIGRLRFRAIMSLKQAALDACETERSVTVIFRNATQASQSPIRLRNQFGKVLLAAAVAGTVLMGCGTPKEPDLIDEPPGGQPPATDTQPDPSPPGDTQPDSPAPGDSGSEQQPPENGDTPTPDGDQDSSDGSTEKTP